nr:MAG TPA: hypothetical protein [Caudoviricetes sp.]
MRIQFIRKAASSKGAAFLCLFRRLHSHSAAGITFLF